MSKTVDERVVSMQFDNRHFENNVKTSLNTIDKLKQSLNLTGATKGLENVNNAVKNVDANPLIESANKVQVSWSKLDMVITDYVRTWGARIFNLGENLVKSLTVDNIAAGWSKYGSKTASVQTIMNATGKTIDEVNGYLDKLMWFSDETSYGFTDMTAALAQMTSSGGKIEKLIPMITGVANATAYAGKGAAEFSE